MTTQPINDDIVHYLLRHMSTACQREIMVLENNQIAYSTGFKRLGFGNDEISISDLVGAATPEARQTIMNTPAVWKKFLDKFPEANIGRCYLSINLQFTLETERRFLLFTFTHMDEQRQLVFVKEGSPDFDSLPRILDPHAKRGYIYDGNDWRAEDWNLSKMEYNILHLSAQGQSVKDIADQMNLSADTVNFHKKKIFRKMGSQSALGALTIFAQRTGIPLEGTPIVMNNLCMPF